MLRIKNKFKSNPGICINANSGEIRKANLCDINNLSFKLGEPPCTSGVYVFQISEDFEMTLFDLFKDFLVLNRKGDLLMVCSPRINIEKDSLAKTIIKFKKDQLLYCGRAKNLKTRLGQHLNDKINHTSSLKLGLRENLKKHLVYKYAELDEKNISENEKVIRNAFNVWFDS